MDQNTSPGLDQPAPKPAARDEGEQQFVMQFMYMLRAPLVGTPGWCDTLKDRWSDALLQRLARHKETFAAQQCTEYEAMLYLSSASLEAPMPHGWAEIYFWLFSRWNPKAAAENNIPAPELDTSQKEDLARLRRWIFKRQIERLKQRLKAQENPRPAATPAPRLEETKPDFVQARLF